MPQIAPILTDAASVQSFGPGGILNQLPGLKQTADAERLTLTTINEYKNLAGNQYGSTHPNALSDNDEKGRGDANNQVGTIIDIQTQQFLTYSSGNKYEPGAGYNNFNYPQQYW
jgi:hypothetical protein